MEIDSTKQALSPEVPRIIELEKRIKELETENTRLGEIVITDELTGLKSRRAILDSLDQEIDRANRGKIKLCAVYIDVDNFRKVNTDYGHEQGDEVLRKVAERLKDGTRKADSLGRLSGDEFLLLIPLDPDEQEKKLQNILQRHIEAVRKVNRSNRPEEFIDQTISLGCVIVSPEISLAENMAKKIKEQADQALSSSKAAGKSRFVIAHYHPTF